MVHLSETFTEEVPGILSAQLFSEKLCRKLIDEANQLNQWEPALIHGGHEGEHVRWVEDTDVRQARITSLNNLPLLSKEFNTKFEQCMLPSVNKHWKVNLKNHVGGQLISYTQGGHYEIHADSGPDLEDRFFSVICYLNDDFTGGSTSFPTLNYSVIPRCGKVVIFPSEYLHQAESIMSGMKYIIVTWIIGMPPVDWI